MIEQVSHVSILKSGPGTSIQDLGRKAWAHYGVPRSGVSDKISAEWVNHVLRNEPDAAVVEISQPGLKIQFFHSCEIALAGAACNLFLNDTLLTPIQKLKIKNKDILEIGAFSVGVKIYLGVKGGFQTAQSLGSRSYYPEITPKTFVQKGDLIPFLSYPVDVPSNFSIPKWDTSWFETENLEFYPGPDYGLLSHENREALHTQEFTISPLSSRMGTLLHESLLNTLPELPTNPVYPGVVQLTSGGKLIILGPDAQVTGGYPRIMLLTEFSQSIIAQKKPGQKVRFIKKSP